LIIDYDDKFNYSAMNNIAAKMASGKYLLFLNNDVKAISDDFILALKEHAQRKEVGAVGAKLLFEDMTVQHAGVVLGVGGLADHSFRFFHHDNDGYFGQANLIRNVSVVTGACMMMRKEVFMQAGGFDEENLKIAFNDVDLCIKIRLAGYLNVYTPYCVLHHFESISRGRKVRKYEVVFMQKKYNDLLLNDPYYNINLSLDSVHYIPDVF
jgi:GT2 family glycosyltransferase